ncbi:MAG: chemotaxis protein CheB [Leptolyngbyaceae cyanobacterium bins.349]|nr:chemotaxis protein CheB [Leptolyngbyaceae cyanobacterium bins.349]
MVGHNIIVVGTSAGGVETLTRLVQRLPANLPAAVFVVMHFPAFGVNVLPQILSRQGTLPAVHAAHNEAIQLGRIYIAPPDYHLLIHRHTIKLSHGPRENGHRPAVDTLFRSAAWSYGKRVVGVVLSGMLDDGTAGLAMIKARGGIAIAQDPDEAIFNGMPRSAIERVTVDHILNLKDLAICLIQLTQTNVVEDTPVTPENNADAEYVSQDRAALERGERPGTVSPLTCPECGGVMWELDDPLLRFRCHTGHAYSLDSLLSEQADEVERALWSAVRVLEEKVSLSHRMANHAREQQRSLSVTQFEERAAEAKRHADLLRQVILQQKQMTNQEAEN